MSADSNRKWMRIDNRRSRAVDLFNSWENGNREMVLRELHRAHVRRLAAFVSVCLDNCNPKAASDVCEAIYRERAP